MAKTTTTAPPEDLEEKQYIITKAALKNDFCNYSYEIATGVTKGDEVNRKGSLLVHDDMFAAFKKLHAHLAAICEEVDTNRIKDIDAIAPYNEEAHLENKSAYEKSIEYKISRFSVDSFSLSGTGENASVKLYGSKELSTGDHVSLTSPETEFKGRYHFVNELRAAIDDCIFEVEEYMNGKSKPRMIQPELPGLDGNSQEGGETFD